MEKNESLITNTDSHIRVMSYKILKQILIQANIMGMETEEYDKLGQFIYDELKAIQVQAKVKVNFAEVKRKFDNIPTYKILYDNDEGITFDAHLIKMDKTVLWTWIEKNILSKISA